VLADIISWNYSTQHVDEKLNGQVGEWWYLKKRIVLPITLSSNFHDI
jgi:hypothetical protein